MKIAHTATAAAIAIAPTPLLAAFGGLLASGVILAAPDAVAHADPCNNQACLSQPFSSAGGPYVGEWQAHREHVSVSSDGNGTEVSNYGTVTFKMGSVSTDQPITAMGNVINGGRIPTGSYVTMQLVDGGNGMLFSMGGGDQSFPFCKVVNGAYANSADCGA
ncbi:MAG TPA: hypothetical protein VH166_06940 [Mycobacterium sp.]|nr:hypothetical protein [Mycobacterium sp.]